MIIKKDAIMSAELIKISTLKKSHAAQIQWADMPDLKDIHRAIHPETGDLAKAEVLGRIPGRTLKELGQVNASTIHWCYLVQTPVGLFWMNAPDKTSDVFKYYQTHVSQLFV